ncbi:restriction endonuclease subunit S [Vibrio fluvialis]|nr:restriction endonuclease subunit S [Vibrio fluvialis]EKO3459361.1 restriction endonuclease subunit S [Vibrio fluvialis]EKO3513365.1 restriction endonuclease subunit S [Vibrio fluvialis]ELE8120963.1 restriction endonuclease subunit S [Vibrio fluvialis]EMA2479901.1 restriction endonuclease subunit S [Vibrio fluvialis]
MSWQTKKLGDVCDIIKRGIAPKYLEDGGVCVINQKCIRDHAINYDLARRHDVSVKKVPQERYIKVGDVLVNSTGTGTLGRVAQVRNMPVEPSTVDTHVTIVRPKEDYFFDEFFGYMLIMIEDQITSSGEGASGQTELSRTKLEKEFFVSYPTSKSEQQKIVTILDKAFVDIEQARANTEQNLQNAREVFDSYLQQVFSERGGDWEEVELGQVVEFLNGFAFKSKDFVQESDVQLLRMGNLYKNKLDLERKSVYCPNSFLKDYSRYLLEEGDIVLSLTGTAGQRDFGYAVEIREQPNHLLLNQRIAKISKIDDRLSSKFLLHILRSKVFLDELFSASTGTRQANVSTSAIKKIKIAFPSLDKQIQLIKAISALEEKVMQLNSVYSKKLAALDELKQSLLQQAFTGQLTQG